MPKCGRKTEVYSRIVGYLRPVQNWNEGKAAEFHDRKTLDRGWHEAVRDATDAAERAEPHESPVGQAAAG